MSIPLSEIPAPRFSALRLPKRAELPSRLSMFWGQLWLMLRVLAVLFVILLVSVSAGVLSGIAVIEWVLTP